MTKKPNLQSHSLQSGAPPTVKTWLPGETLFSLVSRQHMLSSNNLCTDTCLSWFGHPHIGSAHDLPARIKYFTEQTDGRFGSVMSIIYEHTLLSYYLPFRTEHVRANAVASMAGESIGSLKAKLGILATRFGASHPLKGCQQCIPEDEAKHHVSYWHVEHQLPGVWICPWHKQLLEIAQVKWMGINRFGWCLPGNSESTFLSAINGHQSPDPEMLHRLATASIQLWALPSSFHFSREHLIQVFLEEMMRKELCSRSQRINAKRFGTSIFDVTKRLESIRELSALPQSPDKCASSFYRLLLPQRSSAHPLRQLVLILSLFDDWDNFFNRYMQMSSRTATAVGNVNNQCLSGHVEEVSNKPGKRTEFFENLSLCKGSIHSAAVRTGISVSTGMSWAAAANIQIRHRGKILKPELRAQLINSLRQGIDKDEAAKLYGVSKQTITTTLRTEAGLHAQWNQARFECMQKRARNLWKKAAAELPLPTTSMLRSHHPAVFMWLYRHDRAWLNAFSNGLPQASPKKNHSAIKWEQRDVNLAELVSAAASTWCQQHSKGYLTNAVLCQLVPELKTRLSQLARLPRTKAILAVITRKVNSNA